MRITNSMMTSRMLLNMQRNMNYLDLMQNQLSTGKRIFVPSDDPIAAARALKFRTSVSQTEQYRRNVEQGLSWMGATDNVFSNLTGPNGALTQIRELLVTGANASNEPADRAAIAASIRQLKASIGQSMNQTHAGRYIFAGFRTDQPPVFTAANNRMFNINQRFDGRDVELTQSLVRINDTTAPVMHEVRLLKLAYSGAADLTITVNGTAVTVIPKNLTDADAHYPVPANSVHFIAETGELVLSAEVHSQLVNGATMQVNYNKTGFREGDLNPLLYFDTVEMQDAAWLDRIFSTAITNDPVRLVQNMTGPLTPGAGNTGTIALAYGDIAVPVTVTIGGQVHIAQPMGTAGANITFDPATGELTFTELLRDTINALPAGQTFSVSYTKSTFAIGDLNPLHNPNIASATSLAHPPSFRAFTMDGQMLEYEFGINTRINVNTLAKNVFTDKLFADLRVFLDFVESVSISDENKLRAQIQAANPNMTVEEVAEAAERQLTRERQEANAVLYNRFNNMKGIMDRHFRAASAQETDLGSRMERLTMIQSRLRDDLTNYRRMMSENEDVELEDAAIRLSMARAAFETSLRVGASIIQLTLADFIR